MQPQDIQFEPENLFAPVARLENIGVLFAKAAAQRLTLETLDVSNTYLYEDLDEFLILEQPNNSSGASFGPEKIGLLLKSTYGVKQADQILGSLMQSELIRLGFRQSSTDSLLYLLSFKSRNLIPVIVLDDILKACNS